MGNNSGLTWEGDMFDRVNQFGPRIKRAMVVAAKYVEPRAQAWMRTEAPWTDRSSNARNGLFAETEVTRNTVVIWLFHSVPYGPWLELRWSGRYQIINPTVEVFAPVLLDQIADLAFKEK